MLKATGLLAAALLLISPGAAYSRSQASPTTLVWAKSTIEAFAQDGNRIAWASTNNHSLPCTVRIGLLGAKRQKNLVTKSARLWWCSVGSGLVDPSREINLALAGKRALWTWWEGGNVTHVYLVTASAGTRRVTLEELVSDTELDGDYFGGTSGDSSTLVYGDVWVGSDENGVVVGGGGVKRVTGAHKVAIPGAPPPAMLAASGQRVAIVVAETAEGNGMTAHPGSPAHAVVIDAVTGASVGSFSPAGKPLALAFAPSVVAVLESTAGGRQIEFRTPAGALLRTVVVEAKATGLSTTNTRAVFAVGKSIRTVGVRTGSVRQIATAKAMPIGLSIEGKRVAWAENVKIHGVLRGRIRAITVR